MAGCASGGGSPLTGDFIVTVATMKVIEGAENPTAKAERVIDIAETARAVLGSDTAVMVSELEAKVVAAIDWDSLSPSDYVLAATLIETVSKDLSARVDTAGFLQSTELVYASGVLTTIINAATRYVAFASQGA